jgi:hypothetical protein
LPTRPRFRRWTRIWWPPTGWKRDRAARFATGPATACTFVSKVLEGQDLSFRLGADAWQVRAGGTVHSGDIGVPPETWMHLALVYDGTTIRVLGDGYEGYSGPATGNVDFGEEIHRDIVTVVEP